jgi:hypothetical protein
LLTTCRCFHLQAYAPVAVVAAANNNNASANNSNDNAYSDDENGDLADVE